MINWAAYILATAALLWSHYFGLLLIAVQQLVFVGVLVHRKRTGQPVKPLALGFAYSLAVLVMQLVPLVVFAHHQFQVTSAAAGSPSGTYDYLSFYSVLANMAWSLWGYQPDAITVLLAALWPLFLLLRWSCSAAADRARRWASPPPRSPSSVLLIVVSAFDRSLFEVRNFLLLVPLVLLLVARLITGWIRQPRARLLVAGGVVADAAHRPGRPAAEQDQSPAVRLPRRDPGHRGECRAERARPLRAARHALRARVLRPRPPEPAPLHPDIRPDRRGARSSSSPRSRATRRSSTRRTRSWDSSRFFRTLGAPLQDAPNTRVGVSMSSQPWDVRLRRVDVAAGADRLERAPAGPHPDPPRRALRRVVLRLAAEPGPRRHPLPVRDPDRGRAVQPHPGARLLVDVRQRAGAREAGAEPTRRRRRVHPGVQGAAGHRRPDGGRRRRAARR